METDIQVVLGSHLTNYMETWTEIDSMLDRVTDRAFRHSRQDSFGGGWIYNWFCLDHIGYEYNPRRRDIGFHNVFDHYRERLDRDSEGGDALHWHFHPMSTYRDAHRCATHYFRSPEVFEIICRKIIQRSFFPSCFRAGFQAERPDSHWFLEQWIPFDLSNMSLEDNSELDGVIDFRNGRSGDWRLAPSNWSIYHPDHDNYQLPGNCRRWIGRALNVMNRIGNIDQSEMNKAFAQAASGQPALVGVCSHDFRDLEPEVEFLRDLIDGARTKYPEAYVKFSEATDAFRAVAGADEDRTLEFTVELHPARDGDVPFIEVATRKGRVFGPQPFLAIETKSRRFVHDNFDFSTSLDRWFYAFHPDTLPLEDVARIGVAANDAYGNVCVRNISLDD